jgi:hypothetical protein
LAASFTLAAETVSMSLPQHAFKGGTVSAGNKGNEEGRQSVLVRHKQIKELEGGGENYSLVLGLL